MSRKQMKVFSIIITLLLATQMLVSCAKDTKEEVATGVSWLTSYEEAMTAAKKNKQPVMIDFYADWCAPCRFINDTLDQICEGFQDELKVVKVDTENSPVVASKFKVTGLPTLILLKSGKEKERFVGITSKENLEIAISTVI